MLTKESIRETLVRYSQLELPTLCHLKPGLTTIEIDDILISFPLRLPADIHELYLWRNGTSEDAPMLNLFPAGVWHSLNAALAEYQMLMEFDLHREESTTPEPIDAYTITENLGQWNPYLLPIFHDGGGGHEAIICMPHETASSPVYSVYSFDPDIYLEYDSLNSMLQTAIAAFEENIFANNRNRLEYRQKMSELHNRYNPLRRDYLLRTSGAKTIEDLVALLGFPDHKTAGRAVGALTRLFDFTAIPLLLQEIHSSNKQVRASAAKLLGDYGHTEFIKPLNELIDDESESVRTSAKHALKMIEYWTKEQE